MFKDSNTKYNIIWIKTPEAPPYKSGSYRCALCLMEKTTNITINLRGLLNKQTELIAKS